MIKSIFLHVFLMYSCIITWGSGELNPHDERHEPISREESSTTTKSISHYFNRDEYIKAQIQEMIAEEKELKKRILKDQRCANFWTTGNALASSAIVVIGVVGATTWLDPRIANVLTACGAGLNGLFLWLSMQYKKSETNEIERQKKIREALGVPNRIIIPEMSNSFEQFKSPS